MRLATVGLFVAGSLVAAGLAVPPLATAAPTSPVSTSTSVFVGDLDRVQVAALRSVGLDQESISSLPGAAAGRSRVEVILDRGAAASLQAKGLPLREKTIDGSAVSSRLAAAAAPTVFKPYSGAGGLKELYTAAAAANPSLVKLITIGRTAGGQDIIALKITKNARKVADGTRPAVLYISAQHAREWITPEMTRRLFEHYLDGYGTDRTITSIIDTTELWFVPVSNPDGYDYTFTDDRLWRKNLRDNNNDGLTQPGDGVDPNRNYGYKWGYDNEGSSDSPASEVYRGPSASSEPETLAMDSLFRRAKPKFLVNYHSAAELNLYGIGWQVATPSPDDLLYEALAGDDTLSAIPGYDPDLSADLYTTNGDTDSYATNRRRIAAFTPEMSTCQTASDADPGDAFEADDCESVFNFPDSEPLIQAEFAKNIPFALSLAKSAATPDEPVTATGRKTPDFRPDVFTSSVGPTQTVAVTARRRMNGLKLNYRIDGGPVKTASVKEWSGGERYGDGDDLYFAEYRGTVRDIPAGSKVLVWFSATKDGKARESARFTFTRTALAQKPVLVVANEDYEGVNPTYPASTTSPKYARLYVDALRAKGISAEVWDVSARGVPHHLGVLGHYRAVVWYLGDNRLTQDSRDETIDFFGGEEPDAAVARRAQDLTVAMRDYLNEGGRLVHSGETAGYFGQFGTGLGGIYYGLDDAPSSECVVAVDPFADCAILSDDFTQYYLGAYGRVPTDGPSGVVGSGAPFTGVSGTFGGPAVAANPLDEAGNFVATSDVLPAAQFPLYRSALSSSYGSAGGVAPFTPSEGSWYAGALHRDNSYARLTRTIDLTGVTAAQAPTLRMALDHDVEPGYDNVILEAHTAGQDDWTTLPEAGGATSTDVPTECEGGFLIEQHPFLSRYLTPGAPCAATGTSGAWNAFTGTSGGPQQVAFDLSAYAGTSVEVSVGYVSDSSVGGLGVTVDDTRVTIGASATLTEGFETSLGAWTPTAEPADNPTGGTTFVRSQALVGSSVTTRDTVLLGYGVEQLATPAQRAAVLGGAVRYLLR